MQRDDYSKRSDTVNNGLFMQAYHQLNDLDPAQLRSNYQSWNVTMKGESGVDVRPSLYIVYCI